MLICVLDLSLQTIGPGSNNAAISSLSANGNIMEINLEGLAKNNNGEKNIMKKMMTVTKLYIKKTPKHLFCILTYWK